MSGVDRLPLPLLLQVLSNLQIEGLSEARRVNKQWKAASDSDKVWRNLFGQYYEPQSATALVDSETRRWRNKFISLGTFLVLSLPKVLKNPLATPRKHTTLVNFRSAVALFAAKGNSPTIP
jgi:hypothetical protein